MKIEDNSIVLRHWKEEDAERLAEIANNKKIFDNLRDGFPNPYTIEDARRFIDMQISGSNKLFKGFAIEVEGVLAGSIGASFKEDVYRKNAEIGYWLAEGFWGRGIMTKAVKLIVKYIFEEFDIIRIYAEPYAVNRGSRKCLEKAGFKLEACFKDNVIKNNIIQDSCMYSLLKKDYLGVGH